MKRQFTIILLAFSLSLSAQSNLDSLYSVWQDLNQPDSTRVIAYKNYIWNGFMFSKPDGAFTLAEPLFSFAIQYEYERAKAHGLYIQGVSLHLRGVYSKALVYYQNSLTIFEEIGGQEGIGSCLNATGLIYLDKNDYTKALNYFTHCLKIREETDDKEGLASVLNNIGYIYHSQGDYPYALDYYSQSLNIRREIGDQQGIATSFVNIGEIYSAQDDYLKALDYFSRALKIFEEVGDQRGIATILDNFGIIYNNQGDYTKALDYHMESLKIREDIDNQQGIVSSLKSIGNTYKKAGDYSKAIIYCQKGFELAKIIGVLFEQKESCECLYDVYKAIGNRNKTLEYLELLNVIEDSLYAEEISMKLQQMEFTKQVLQDSISTAEKERLAQKAHEDEMREEEKTRNISFGIGGLVLLLAGGLYSRLRYVRKSKASLQLEKDRSENLLLNILPADIARELKEKGRADARDFDMVSILFTDFKGFTQASAILSAQDLVTEINSCFEAFDGIMEKYGVEKIKTIGDAYMAAGGLPVPSDGSVKNTVLAALEMQGFIEERKKTKEERGESAFEMRVGIHTGQVVAGIVGVKKFQYDIWGDAVNTASRMESNGKVAKVNISHSTYDLLKDDSDFSFVNRGKIDVKGKGKIDMYFVHKT